MGLLRSRTNGVHDTVGAGVGSDEDVYVVSSKAAGHAVRAEKEKRRAARADRRLAETRRQAVATAAKKGAAPPELDVENPDGGAASSTASTKKGKKSKKADAGSGPVTGATVKRYIGVARVVVPVLAPLVYQAVGEARSRWDDHQARRLGVAPEQLADFSGRGAALYARIHHLALSVGDLGTRRGDDRETVAFVDDARTRLADLEAAVRSAEQMPSSRRRSAHVAVSSELDRLETRLLAFWGVDGGRQQAPGRLPAGDTGSSSASR